MTDTHHAHDQDVLARGLQGLLDLLGIGFDDAGATLAFTGSEPVFKSRLRIATAMAIPIAAEALGVAALWRLRTGRRQSIEVDLRVAGAAVNSTYYIRQSGYSIGYGFAITDPLTGFFRAGDGRWVRTLGSRPVLRDLMLDLLGCANTVPAITRAIGQWTAQELEDAANSRGTVCTLIRSEEEWRAHPQGQALAQQPVIALRRVADSPIEPLGPGDRPLSGVRVIEMTHILAGPGASRALAAQGAEVIRISSPIASDPHYMIVDTGFGKKTAFLDLNTPEDVARFKELIAGSDVFINSQRPGSLDARGLSSEELRRVRPGLITLGIDCYGDGPWFGRRGFDPNAQSACGIAIEEASFDAPRPPTSNLLADFLCSYLGAAAVVAALYRRATVGGSYEARVSLTGAAMWVQGLGRFDAERIVAIPPGMPEMNNIQTMHSPFGLLHYLPPIAQFSETKGYWSSPPLPLGACPAAWEGGR
jgi:crotonobetainyl-CoA:carnitine CoA-transferase CaiB-like acyl-CoA transferase